MMYGQVSSEQAKFDLHILLKDDIWQPEIRTSMFQKFIGNRPSQEAATNYKRVTCCLYKELQDMDACPYCPLKKEQG